jgi:hypothetical protein
MLSMLNELVDEREDKLFEGAKKIESKELSNQKEADILNRVDSLSAWAEDKRSQGLCPSKQQTQKLLLQPTWRLTIGELSILVSSQFLLAEMRLIILAWWSSSMIPS